MADPSWRAARATLGQWARRLEDYPGDDRISDLLGFLKRRYPQLGAGDIDTFTRLLEYPDSVLLEWLMGHMVPSDKDVAHIVREIRHAAVS